MQPPKPILPLLVVVAMLVYATAISYGHDGPQADHNAIKVDGTCTTNSGGIQHSHVGQTGDWHIDHDGFDNNEMHCHMVAQWSPPPVYSTPVPTGTPTPEPTITPTTTPTPEPTITPTATPTPMPTLSAPGSLSISDMWTFSFYASWDAVPNATGYAYQYRINDGKWSAGTARGTARTVSLLTWSNHLRGWRHRNLRSQSHRSRVQGLALHQCQRDLFLASDAGHTHGDAYANGDYYANRDARGIAGELAYRHSDGNGYCHTYLDTHGYAYANADLYTDAHAHCDPNADSDLYAHSYANRHSDCDAYRDAHAYANGYRYTYANPDGDLYTYRNTHAHSYANRHSNTDSDLYTDANGDGYPYADAQAEIEQSEQRRQR